MYIYMCLYIYSLHQPTPLIPSDQYQDLFSSSFYPSSLSFMHIPCTESTMDSNLRPFHLSSLDSQKIGESLQNPSSNGGHSPAGLMRYHSAPSSIFRSLADHECSVRNEAAAEFSSRLFSSRHGSLGAYSSSSSSSSACESRISLQLTDAAADPNEKHPWIFSGLGNLKRYGSNVTNALGKGNLEHQARISAQRGSEEALAMSMRTDQVDATEERSEERSHASNYCEMQPLSPRIDLIRHGSLTSTNVLTGHSMEDSSSLQMQTVSAREAENRAFLSSKGSLLQMPVKSCFMGLSSPWKADDIGVKANHGLIRHSSSPAGLLSESDFSSITSADKTLLAQCLSADGSVGRSLGLMPGNGVDEWNEASTALEISNAAALATERKRGRESEMNFFKPLPAADLQQLGPLNQVYHNQLSNHFIIHGDDNFTTDAVICKSRAKRGCATHPRSIAERVRRTKISERVKKLTELVPNLDKQAHTADMLDEVVDYVKQLKQQVQKLSESVEKCRCHVIENGSLQM